MKKISPKSIYDFIGQEVVGQDAARRVIATSMFTHFARSVSTGLGGKTFKKSNALLMGPSGSGKTLIVREAIKAVKALSGYEMAPMLEIDCTGLTSKGWQGDDFTDLLEGHYREHWKNKFAVDSTVVFLDEVDKMCMPAVGQGGTDHNRTAQYALLKAVEGMEVEVGKGTKIDTGKMMFVFAGNFPQIRHILAAKEKPGMGFGEATPTAKKEIDIHTQLEMGGMITQLVGRVSAIGQLNKLGVKELRAILVKHVIPEYREMFDFLGYEMKISDYHVRKMVKHAADKGTGARGLQAAMDAHLESAIFGMEYECILPADVEEV